VHKSQATCNFWPTNGPSRNEPTPVGQKLFAHPSAGANISMQFVKRSAIWPNQLNVASAPFNNFTRLLPEANTASWSQVSV